MKELRLIELMGNIDEDLLIRANAPVPLFSKPRFRNALIASAVAVLLVVTMITSPVAVVVSYSNAHPEIEGGLVYIMDAMIKDESHFVSSMLPESAKNTLGSVFDALKGGQEPGEDETGTGAETETETEAETEPEFVMPPASEGLAFELNTENNGYKLIGIGACKDKDLVIPSEHNGLPVTEIYWNYLSGHQAFEQNTTIESVIIPDSVQFIGDYVFYKCTSLKSVTIMPGDLPVEIGFGSFGECTSLEEFIIPDNVIRFSDPFLLSSTNNSTLKVFPKTTEYDNAYYLGNKNNPYFVLVGTKDAALTGCEIHPDTKIIGGGSFYQSALTEIMIPEGVITIDDSAFAQSSALASFSFPDSLRFVGSKAFTKCAAITGFGDFDYVGNADNPYLILFDSEMVSEDEIHPETRYIADEAMAGARIRAATIKTWTIPEHVRYIGKYAFQGESPLGALKAIEIRGDDAYIAKNAFGICNNVTNLYIGRGVTYITPGTFNCMPQLARITVEPGNPFYVSEDNCLIEQNSGTLVRAASESVIPLDGSIKHIASGAYYGLPGDRLPSNPIPDGVISIGSFAFYNFSGSGTIMIPSSVTTIGQTVFANAWEFHYNGTKQEFAKMENNMASNGIVICTDGELSLG